MVPLNHNPSHGRNRKLHTNILGKRMGEVRAGGRKR
jgi:hypothetical protein